ncbi:MAG: hypothetical protein ACPGWR_31375, partial [Ardenticatenaceae bacterium]
MRFWFNISLGMNKLAMLRFYFWGMNKQGCLFYIYSSQEETMSLNIQEVITPGEERAFTVGKQKKGQSLSELDPIYLQLLETGVTAALATMNKSGRPQLTPVWVNHDGTYVNLNS